MKHKLTLLAALLLAPLAALHAVEVLDLRCDYRANPPGIDAEKPELSWKIDIGDQKSEVRGLRQSAYQVLGVYSAAADESLARAGRPATSRTCCW